MPYEYELIYRNEDYSTTVKFSADININDLINNLRYFLLSCSWSKEQLDFLDEE